MGNMKKTAYTQEEFVNKVKSVNPAIQVIGNYTGVENKIEISCKHQGHNMVYAYSLLKYRNCCRKGYFETRILYNKKNIEQRKDEIDKKFNKSIDTTHAVYNNNRDKISNLLCVEHNVMFEQWVNSLTKGIGCPECGKENKRHAGIKMLEIARQRQLDLGNAKFVSKAETKWLDQLGVPIRQHWLEDVKYSVDGFDPFTNTVYLYHGKFWHGCPDTFDPEFTHPILKVKMKQLYEQTIEWENKIKNSGYNLITVWGK
jgi:hypothetical protein